MFESKIFIFNLFLIYSSFFFIKATNLRKNIEEKIPDLDSLLAGIPVSYSLLQKELLSQKTKIKKELSQSYFNSLISTSKIKYYLNKEQKDFNSIIKDIINCMGLSNPQHAYVLDVFEDRIIGHNEYFEINNWMNYNIIITDRIEKNTISFGSLYVSLKDGKYNFIFLYGYGDFNRNYNGGNVVYLGKNGDWHYITIAKAASYYQKDFDFYDSGYLIDFMNFVGFKAFGNAFNLQLPEPKFN